jgi:hypothetical protein
METTENKLTPYQSIFFNKLRNYLDTKLYFYGSIQRKDYFPGLSDIDVDIFTSNENSIISKLISFLNVKRYQFKKIIWKLNDATNLVNGHKIMYIDPNGELTVEFSIYNEKYKNDVLNEHLSKKNLPIYATIILVMLKFLYYKLKIISHDYYASTKKMVLSSFIGRNTDHFVKL